ncbi:MAG: hypothetical protein AABX52_03335 [Nanoarchaeota archaeon]
MASYSVDLQNQRMNGWYWQHHVLRVLVSALGFQNQRIYDEVIKYKRNYWYARRGKSIPNIIMQENDGLAGIVKGIEHQFPGLEHGLHKLSDSGNLYNALAHSDAAFVIVKSRSVSSANGGKDHKRVPITDLRHDTRTLQNYYINFESPSPEILQSVVGKPRECYGREWPSRVLFNLDVEYHTPYKQAGDDDVNLFNRIEPARKIIEWELMCYGIPHTCIMTGKGYHFISQVRGSSPFMEDLIKMGWKIEEGVIARLNSNEMSEKIGFRIPIRAEEAYKAITRLQQFFFSKVIRRIRKETALRVEVSDRGSDCLVLDNTSQLRFSHTGNVAVVASPYEKFYEGGGRVMARLTRSYNGRERIYICDAHKRRRYIDSSLAHIHHDVGYIPEGSEGLWNLMKDYYQGSLFKELHNPMDHVDHEHPWTWGRTYRHDDYHYLDGVVGDVWQYGENRGPHNLLNPDVLNHFVFSLDKARWHPKHIAGLLRAIYEDQRFGWGDVFFTNNAERHANGWVEIILGQKYEWV